MRNAASRPFPGVEMSRLTCSLVMIFVLAGFSAAANAQQQNAGDKSGEKGAEKPGDKTDKTKDEKKPEEKVVQTKHAVKIGGQEIKYTATAGTILLKLEDGTPKASVFYVAYTKDDVTDAAKRPVTFTFNGGAGAASSRPHLSAFGPRRVGMGAACALLSPPYKRVGNNHCYLDIMALC